MVGALSACSLVPRSFFEEEPYNARLPIEFSDTTPYDDLWGGTSIASFAVPWYLRFVKSSDLDIQCGEDEGCAVRLANLCRWELINRARGLAGSEEGIQACARFPVDRNLVTLSISGGTMRSAMLARAVMLELSKLGLLEHVDVISAVSGGAILAALYTLSCDDAEDCKAYLRDPEEVLQWQSSEVDTRLQRDVLMSSIISIGKPWNLPAFAVTDYNRTDLFSDSFANLIYKKGAALPLDKEHGRDFGEFNPLRPNLLIGATLMTDLRGGIETRTGRLRPSVGSCFYFTLEDFELIRSDLSSLPISDAVAGSNAFPGIFYPLVLEQFPTLEEKDASRKFLHLQDGGIRDQAAVSPITEIMFNLFSGVAETLAYRAPLDFCDISRITQAPDEAPAYSVPKWVASVLEGRDFAAAFPEQAQLLGGHHKHTLGNGITIRPERIINIFIDAAIPSQGLSHTSPMAIYDFWDSIIGHRKVVEPVNVIIDDQRVLRFTDFAQLRSKIMQTYRLESEIATASQRNADETAICCHGIAFAVHDFLLGHRLPLNESACTSTDFEKEWSTLRGPRDAGIFAFSIQDASACNDKSSDRESFYEGIVEMGMDFDVDDRERKMIRAAAADLVGRMSQTLCLADNRGTHQPNIGSHLFGLADLPCEVNQSAE